MKKDKFKGLINKYRELELLEIKITGDARVDRKSEKWLNLIVKNK